ncbi:hypothetical protein [Prevotella melaninogenica]|uniref:hypothetical protein n=1 Tax=Prevotella melaninogenica TaxID=28132 RepID=UPI00195B1B08|nr:hypothetical protein [Prevotella melaninogenica]
MRIIKKPFLINMPLFSIVRIDHNKLSFHSLPLCGGSAHMVRMVSTHGAEA